MRRFRVIRGELDKAAPQSTQQAQRDPQRDDPTADPALTRRLRSLYTTPSDGYWDGLEATIMAAVRASRAAPTAAVEWWHTLAAWARPGLAAAAVLLTVVGGVALQTRGAQNLAQRSVLEPLDEDIARASDPWAIDDAASPAASRDARAVRDLLSDGVKQPGRIPSLELEAAAAAERAARPFPDEESLRANRDSVFSSVIP